MKILMSGAECSEVASVGGVGEYTLGLATELVAHGHEVDVVIPLYGFLAEAEDLEPITNRLMVPLGVGSSECALVRRWPASRLPFAVTLIGSHRHFDSVGSPADIYQHWPNHEPWIAFSRSVLAYMAKTDWDPDILHCLDSHAALIPVFMHDSQRNRWDCPPARPATVLTIHNLLNQGKGDAGLLEWAGLHPGYWYHDWFEFYGGANCFKAGLLTADRVSTVSRTYATEICQSPDFGFGLEGILSSLRDRRRLEWILNGITPARWNVEGVTYGAGARDSDVARVKRAKRQRRAELLSAWGWDDDGTPVIAVRSRWDRQKGVVELVECIRKCQDVARFLVVAWGHPEAGAELARAWRRLEKLQAERPDRVVLNPESLVGQHNGANHYAVADFLLVPSLYEPCGLTQMECQRFGAVPIVRATGGLADTVSEVANTNFGSPNGFVFTEPLGEHMADRMSDAVRRAITTFTTPAGDEMIRHGLEQENGWSNRINDYQALYQNAAMARFGEVVGCLSQRAAMSRGQGDVQGEANALRRLGDTYAAQSRAGEAREHWERARDLYAALGSAEAEEIELVLAGAA
ncbi:MAG: glycogen synthase [Candidatus Dormibacteria bacterium]